MATNEIIIAFTSPEATLQIAGGKAANLARLTRAGFRVPRGFIISTNAYNTFVSGNHLAEEIAKFTSGISASDANQLEKASTSIRQAFSAASMPGETDRVVRAAYSQFNGAPVAVRSSATMEDLPDLSFAGQQDTYLNVIGMDALLKAVVGCWSSLWTARAIGYRLRNGFEGDGAALAVVVQEMVQSDASGVLFTANPLSGLRNETVIDATFGLGEALVSGQVEPDHFVVDSNSGAIKQVALGAKQVATRSKAGGGVETLAEEGNSRQTLTEDQIRQLASLGQQVQKEYGAPQDIEWAFAGGALFILQARPITSLFPVPCVSFDPLIVWFSFAAFQGIVGPMTPLGQEAIQRVILGVGKKLGLIIKFEQQDVFVAAGERIWIKVSDLIRNPLGNRLLGGFLGIGEPGAVVILRQLTNDPRLGAGQGRLRLNTLRRVLGFVLPALGEILRAVLHPENARDRFDARLDAYLQTVHIPTGEDRFERLANFASFMGDQGGLADALPILLPRFMPIMAPSLAALNLIGHLLPPDEAGKHGISMPVLDITRGLPRNVTIEMDLALWEVATIIKGDAAAAEAFGSANAAVLASHYLEGNLPQAAQAAVKGFLARYGMRGTGEIDLGQPRWREDPTPILETLQSYLQIAPEAAPNLLYERNVRAAEEAIERMATEVRRQHSGWIKEKILRGAARRVRLLLGARESPKFYAVRAMGIVRNVLLEIGEEFAAAGTIRRGKDLFYLHVDELASLSHQENRDWKALIHERRLIYERELRRRQVPRVLVSDGRAFYEGVGADSDTGDILTGSPVSPGVVEGVVHVVFNPLGAQLAPGEILVCPGTDPAWTPLFLAAGGLITEVGGMMTHGSVVAREYGIPAVVGVHQATLRLKDGQRVRVNGTTGKIMVIMEDAIETSSE